VAVTFDAGGSEIFSDQPTSHSFAFTVGSNSDLFLHIAVVLDTSTDQNATATYNSVSATEIALLSGGATFRLVAPATGSNTLAAAWDNAHDGVLGVQSLYNVNQSTPVGTNDSTSGTGEANSTGAVTDSATDDLVINAVHINNLTTAPTSDEDGMTQSWQAIGASGDVTGTGERKDGASGTVTLGQAWSGNQNWFQHTINVKQVVAAAGPNILIALLHQRRFGQVP